MAKPALRSKPTNGRVSGRSHPPLVTVARIQQAARRLRRVAIVTPLLRWDADTLLKPESLQPTGSFKIRGAYNRLSLLREKERRKGIVAYSSGNHAQAVARAANILGIDALIVMPANAPANKVAHVVEDGARIVQCGPGSNERRLLAERIAEETGRVLVAPYDDLDVIAGQGTIGLEILRQEPMLGSVLIPIGGGGLASGVATAIKLLRPQVRMIGVEPELAADARESLRRDEIVTWSAEDTVRTIADGLRTQAVGKITFEHLRRYVDEVVTVSDSEITGTMLDLADRCHLIVEPSGAVALAAHAAGRVLKGRKRVVVLSGGNVSLDNMTRLTRRESLAPG